MLLQNLRLSVQHFDKAGHGVPEPNLAAGAKIRIKVATYQATSVSGVEVWQCQ